MHRIDQDLEFYSAGKQSANRAIVTFVTFFVSRNRNTGSGYCETSCAQLIHKFQLVKQCHCSTNLEVLYLIHLLLSSESNFCYS